MLNHEIHITEVLTSGFLFRVLQFRFKYFVNIPCHTYTVVLEFYVSEMRCFYFILHGLKPEMKVSCSVCTMYKQNLGKLNSKILSFEAPRKEGRTHKKYQISYFLFLYPHSSMKGAVKKK